MSSSEDSEIDLQWQRTIRPKKLIPKFKNFLAMNDASTTTSRNGLSLHDDKSKTTKADSNFEDKPPFIFTDKLERRLPVLLALLIKSSKKQKNVKFDLQSQNNQKQQNLIDLALNEQEKNSKKSFKIRFCEEDSEKEEEEIQLFQPAQKIQRIRKLTKTCKNLYGKDKSPSIIQEIARLQQKTTSIFSNTQIRSQIVKEYMKNGNRIRTSWLRGLINGYTEIDYSDKGKFRGIFKEGELVSGQMTFPNKFVYTGEFLNFTFHGFGKLKFPSGQIFQGNWICGYLKGKGKIIYPKGQMYCGQISNFKRDGEGYLYFPNGCKYVGEFYRGQITGYGQFHKDGILAHKGYWINGKFYGQDFDTYLQQKKILDQEERMKKSKKGTKKSDTILKSMKRIEQIHTALNQAEQGQNVCSEVKLLEINNNGNTSIIFDKIKKEPKKPRASRPKNQVSLMNFS